MPALVPGTATAMNLSSLAAVYKGKNVFLTGHTGFKGAWLLQWLHLLGANVKGYALAPQHSADLYHVIDGDTLCESVIADVTNKAALEEAVLRFQPDFIFHLAAQPLVRLSYAIPSETFAVNAIGTAYLLDAVRQLQKPCSVVLITTDKVYENKEWLYPYRETDGLGGHDPYSASKACAELIIHSYVHSFFPAAAYATHQKGIASTRAGNVIGGGDWSADRIVPDIVKALVANQPVAVRNPAAVRPWQHVLEPLGGYLMLGAALAEAPQKAAGAWNFGPLLDDNKKVEELVKTAIARWGSGTYQFPELKDQPHEATLLKLDISKAINMLGWMPQYTSGEAIAKTIDWYKAYTENSNGIRDFSIAQVQAYGGL